MTHPLAPRPYIPRRRLDYDEAYEQAYQVYAYAQAIAYHVSGDSNPTYHDLRQAKFIQEVMERRING